MGTRASFGWKTESAWGTRAAPTHFPRVTAPTTDPGVEPIQGMGVTSGAFAPYSGHRVIGGTAPTWSTGEFDYQTRDVIGMFAPFLGTAVSAAQGGTAAYLHTFTEGTTIAGKSLTIQRGVDRTAGGTIDVQEITGCKVTQVDFGCSVGELLKLTIQGTGKAFDTSQSLAAPSYSASEVAPWGGYVAGIKAGTYASETLIPAVKSFSVSMSKPLTDVNRLTGKVEPEPSDYWAVTGSIELDHTAATYQTQLSAGTSTSLILEWVGSLIASSYYQTFRLKLPAVYLDSGNAVTDGVNLTTESYNFSYAYDGSHPALLEIINIETGTTGY